MDLKSLIRPQLWIEISNSYISENYKNAVLDAMRLLSKIIREKSGLDGDGSQLVGSAFGGEEPKLRINKLQTHSERDEQKGFQQILFGLYQAIRNPRAHESIEDTKNSADPIIYFINYLLTILDTAKPPFTIDDFLPRIFDSDFVERADYARELIREIPNSKRLETLIEIYRQKSQGDGRKLAFVVRELVTLLQESEINEFIQVVSEELDIVSDNKVILKIIQLFPFEYWGRVKKTAKMRIENKMIASIKIGEVIFSNRKLRNLDGVLGTWISRIVQSMFLVDDLRKVIIEKLKNSNLENALYIFTYFWREIPNILISDYHRKICIDTMYKIILLNDEKFETLLVELIPEYPENWRQEIYKRFESVTDMDNPKYYTTEGIPFLGKVPLPQGIPEEDIPF